MQNVAYFLQASKWSGGRLETALSLQWESLYPERQSLYWNRALFHIAMVSHSSPNILFYYGSKFPHFLKRFSTAWKISYGVFCEFTMWCKFCLTFCYCMGYIVSTQCHRADSRFAPSQWETSLQSNTASHWLVTNLESALSQLLSLHVVTRIAWWLHAMEALSDLLALCEGNPPVTGGSPHRGL